MWGQGTGSHCNHTSKLDLFLRFLFLGFHCPRLCRCCHCRRPAVDVPAARTDTGICNTRKGHPHDDARARGGTRSKPNRMWLPHAASSHPPECCLQRPQAGTRCTRSSSVGLQQSQRVHQPPCQPLRGQHCHPQRLHPSPSSYRQTCPRLRPQLPRQLLAGKQE